MSSTKFKIIKHIIDAQHIREYPNGTRDQKDVVLKMHIKQYKPLNNLDAKSDSITIIGLHGNSMPKECFEPLWDDLLDRAEAASLPIRSIWMADCVHQGESGIDNEMLLGYDPGLYDHARDLLLMVNTLRSEMIAPIFGFGHSMGSAQLVHLAYLHPRLLHSIALVEPALARSRPRGPSVALYPSQRQDLFPNRQIAKELVRKLAPFRTLDPRVIDRYTEYGLRDIPTAVYPDRDAAVQALVSMGMPPREGDTPVTLTITKAQDVWTLDRTIFKQISPDIDTDEGRLMNPGMIPSTDEQPITTRPDMGHVYLRLAILRPSVLWLYADKSYMNTPAMNATRIKTGTARGGSGGTKFGRVKEVTLTGAGHMLPFETIGATAEELCVWYKDRWEQWKKDQIFYRSWDMERSDADGLRLSDKLVDHLKHSQEAKPGKQSKI